MIIQPKIRGFICTTTHPSGCLANVKQQIATTQQALAQAPQVGKTPKRVLVIGASSGYGLASRISAAFGYGADTLGVFFEKAPTEKKTGTAGWYNAAAFQSLAREQGLYAKSINGDAFSDAARQQVIQCIQDDWGGQVDLVIYSLASPVRKLPDTGELVRSALKPIGETYRSTAIDTNKDQIIQAEVEPATEEEIANTVKVMGGEDWELWIQALHQAGVLAPDCQTLAYSYIGTELTWPIYWHGALGKAKEDLDRAAQALDTLLSPQGGRARVAVLKSVVTQASSAIPVMPLYISMAFKLMKQEGTHEGCIEQINRLFQQHLYPVETKTQATTDEYKRLRLDDWELRPSIQEECKRLWPQITTENLFELTDYAGYKAEFLKLFGFGCEGVDYQADTSPLVDFDVIDI